MQSKSVLLERSFSTPGKLILSGEHSVVHGKDAIVAALSARTYGEIKLTNTNNNGVNVIAKLKSMDLLV